ncbi:hypothetical protein D3C87_1595300 [compost metagenome]
MHKEVPGCYFKKVLKTTRIICKNIQPDKGNSNKGTNYTTEHLLQPRLLKHIEISTGKPIYNKPEDGYNKDSE